jgi:hypothetical protein
MGGNMKAYKLTDENDQTYGGCQWGENVTHTADGEGGLCTKHWIHYYTDPILGVFMNPIYGEYKNPHMWEGKAGEIIKIDRGLKAGCTRFTTLHRIETPTMTTEQRVYCAIIAALEVCHEESYVRWAQAWILRRDPTRVFPKGINADNIDYPVTTDYPAWASNYALRAAIRVDSEPGCAAVLAAHTVAHASKSPGQEIDPVALAHKAYEWKG